MCPVQDCLGNTIDIQLIGLGLMTHMNKNINVYFAANVFKQLSTIVNRQDPENTCHISVSGLEHCFFHTFNSQFYLPGQT